MAILALALKFLTDNWKLVLLGLAIAYVGFLRWEVGSLRDERDALKLSYANAVATAEAKKKDYEDTNAAITAKYQDAAKKYASLSVENQKNEIKLIMQDKELKSYRLSKHAVSVFNQPADTSSSYSQGVTVPKPADDGKAPTVGEANDSGFTLADLLAVDKRNEARYNICVNQVLDWQRFWIDYTSNVSKVNKDDST